MVGSFFLIFVVLVVIVVAVVAYVVTRGAVSHSLEDDESPTAPRPEHETVTSAYHEHTDLEPGSSDKVDGVSSHREHQDRTP